MNTGKKLNNKLNSPEKKTYLPNIEDSGVTERMDSGSEWNLVLRKKSMKC